MMTTVAAFVALELSSLNFMKTLGDMWRTKNEGQRALRNELSAILIELRGICREPLRSVLYPELDWPGEIPRWADVGLIDCQALHAGVEPEPVAALDRKSLIRASPSGPLPCPSPRNPLRS